MDKIATFILQIIPIVLVLLVYFVRLETRIAKINNDLCWIKKQLSRRRDDGQERKEIYANSDR